MPTTARETLHMLREQSKTRILIYDEIAVFSIFHRKGGNPVDTRRSRKVVGTMLGGILPCIQTTVYARREILKRYRDCQAKARKTAELIPECMAIETQCVVYNARDGAKEPTIRKVLLRHVIPKTAIMGKPQIIIPRNGLILLPDPSDTVAINRYVHQKMMEEKGYQPWIPELGRVRPHGLEYRPRDRSKPWVPSTATGFPLKKLDLVMWEYRIPVPAKSLLTLCEESIIRLPGDASPC